MKPFKCYVYAVGADDKIVRSTKRCPIRDHWEWSYQSREEYMNAIKEWERTFVDVPNAHYNRKIYSIIINNPRDNKIEESSLIIHWGDECLATLTEKGKIEISCVDGVGGWTAGHGTGGDTPEEAISYHNKYVEWLKIRKPGDFPPNYDVL